MLRKGYVVFGTALCLLFAYAAYTGWTLSDSVSSGKWGPHGHSAYHK
jgi:hypothetical protein